ncbi:unnamed protein product, partial [Closterium sp. Naga37s-1]
ETFSEGGYEGVPDKKVVNWPHVASWPNVPTVATPSAKGEAGGIECCVTARLSPNGKAYMVLIGHCVLEQWELRLVILAFVEMPNGHGGKDIAKAVEKLVE